jgi:hypothetical protein
MGDKMKKSIVLLFAMLLMSPLLKGDSLERVGACATGGVPEDTEPSGIYAYVADRGALAIVDISDSTSPLLTFRKNMGSNGVDIDNDFAYVNNQGASFWIGKLFPPDSIVLIKDYDLPNAGLPEPWGIEVQDTILYIANSDRGLFIFNVKNPVNPTPITVYDTPGRLTEFFILDSLIYLADSDSMIILNISNPASPQRVGAIDIFRWSRDVHVVYPYAYATCNSSDGTDGRIYIIDVSAPSNPTIIGMIDGIRGDPRAVYVSDDYIYVASTDWWFPSRKEKGRADVEGGIRIAEGTLPESLIISYDTPGNAYEVYVRGNLLLVPDSDSLLILYHHKTGIEEGGDKKTPLISKFSVYPNPARGIITCRLQFKKSARVILSIYDESGRKIREIYRGPIMPGSMSFFWDGRDQNRNIVPAGEYFMSISTEDGHYNESRKVTYLGGKQ